MRVLVTGADGFIGRYTLPLLVHVGFEVHALCWQREPDSVDGVYWHRINLMDKQDVNGLLAKIQVTHLLHLAWYTEHGKFWSASENLDWLTASLGLLTEFAEHGGKRVVMAGSCAEYDWNAGVCSERTTPYKPSTLYGVCKHSLSEVAAAYCAANDISFAWGRVFFLYGPGEYSGRFIPAIINGLLNGKQVPCSSGEQVRDFMYVEDVASAFVSLLRSDITDAVNIGSGEARSLREIGEEIMSQINAGGLLEFGALPNRDSEPAVLTADVSRLHVELGWSHSRSLQQGLAETIAWWEQHQEKAHAC